MALSLFKAHHIALLVHQSHITYIWTQSRTAPIEIKGHGTIPLPYLSLSQEKILQLPCITDHLHALVRSISGYNPHLYVGLGEDCSLHCFTNADQAFFPQTTAQTAWHTIALSSDSATNVRYCSLGISYHHLVQWHAIAYQCNASLEIMTTALSATLSLFKQRNPNIKWTPELESQLSDYQSVRALINPGHCSDIIKSLDKTANDSTDALDRIIAATLLAK